MAKKNLYAIIGPGGCGKGTQCDLLRDRMFIPHIVMSDLLTARIQRRDLIADYIKKTMNAGRLVTDSVTIGLLREHMSTFDSTEFTLDGYPRTVNQARFLVDELSTEYSIYPVLFQVPDEACVVRAANRARLASEEADRRRAQGERPSSPRSDDDPKVHLERLKIYRGIESAIVSYFENALPSALRTVDGIGDVEQVYGRFTSILPGVLQNQ